MSESACFFAGVAMVALSMVWLLVAVLDVFKRLTGRDE